MAAIGIDRYQSWDGLQNAVHDARGAYEAFLGLGFQEIRRPLFDAAATRQAIYHLVQSELQHLGEQDSLVLFFAGHGHTISTPRFGGTVRKTGYLIPVDAETSNAERDPTETWILLSSWLREIANLSVRHILVILDSCFSGVALEPLMQWRGDQELALPLAELQKLMSRRVIASALANESAEDGYYAGEHSRFTECLIQGLTGEIAAQTREPHITGSSIWTYIKTAFQRLTRARQIPNYGAFENHDHGDLVIPLAGLGARPRRPARHRPEPPVIREADKRPDRGGQQSKPQRTSPAAASLTELAFARLDLQHRQRQLRAPTLSVVAGKLSVARVQWARWASRGGQLTLMTEQHTLDGAINDLLGQLPWMRCLPAARARFAAAAKLDPTAIGASFHARNTMERTRWIGNVAGLDRHVRVSGWLLNVLHEGAAQIPDLATAPVQGAELLSILCDLSSPLAVLMHHASPSQTWLQDAIPVAAELARRLPNQAVALATPTALADQVLAIRGGGGSMSMARQGRADVGSTAPSTTSGARAHARQRLFDALARDRRTTSKFTQNAHAPTDAPGGATAVDLMGKTVRLAIQLDDVDTFGDALDYRTERIKDVWLQNAGFYVLRFLLEDIRLRLEAVVQEIAACLDSRRSIHSTWETFHD